MKKFSAPEDPELSRYILETFSLDSLELQGVEAVQTQIGLPPIQITPFEARHLAVLAQLVQAKRIVEIGTLCGYSGLALLRALPSDAKLITFELRPEHAATATETFRQAGLSDRVRVIVGDAHQRLSEIESEGPFDLLFIDADKGGYPEYLRWGERNLRVGGVLVAENIFLNGKLLSGKEDIPSVSGMKRFLREISNSECWLPTVLPTNDGLVVALRIGEGNWKSRST